MRARSLILLSVLAAAPLQATAGDRAAQNAVDMARAAMEKGHGRMCSLANEPVERGGYWPCLDVPPYRFVAGYGKTTAFVVTDGQPPYPILVSENGEAEFRVAGRWMVDIAPRVTAWWNDEVLGERSLRTSREEGDARHRAAEAQVERHGGPALAQPEGAPEYPSRLQPPPPGMPYPVQQAPQSAQAAAPAARQPLQPAYPVQPPAETDEGLRSRPIPGAAGGVQLAPGVVGYPNGIPGQDARRR